jgi:hypothetical protein
LVNTTQEILQFCNSANSGLDKKFWFRKKVALGVADYFVPLVPTQISLTKSASKAYSK